MAGISTYVELEVLQRHTADLTSVIATNPSLFGQHLVQRGIAVQTTVAGIVDTPGINDYQKASKLLGLVDSKVRTTGTRENARTYFNDFLMIVAHQLGNRDLAESLVVTFKSKDPLYTSPLQEDHASSAGNEQPPPPSVVHTPEASISSSNISQHPSNYSMIRCNLERKFSCLQMRLTDCDGVTVQRLRRCVATLPSFQSDTPGPLLRADSVEVFFHELKKYCSPRNPEILLKLVDVLGVGDEETTRNLSDFQREYECFQQMKLRDLIGNFEDDECMPPGYKELKLKLGDDWCDKTLADLKRLKELISTIMHWILKIIEDGSITVKYLVPNSETLQLSSHLQSQNVLEISMGGKLVFQQKSAAEAGDSMVVDAAPGRKTAAASDTTAKVSHLIENQLERGSMNLGIACSGTGTGTANELHVASLRGELEEVKRLIEEGEFNPLQTDGEKGQNALHYAAWGGHLEVMKYFVEERGYNPTCQDTRGATPLHTAAQCSHLELVQYLVDEKNVDPACLTNTSDTPLHHACTGGNVDVVTFLINAMTKYLPLKDVIELKGGGGWSPVHHAAYFGHLEVIKFFAAKLNFDPLITNDRGHTALHYAAEKGYLHIVKYFIEQLQCNPSPLDRNKWTPLHLAAENGHLEMVKYLTLEQHCDPLCAGQLSITPLHRAAFSGHLEIVKFFVETLHCPSAIGITKPIKLARDNGHHHVVQYLESITK